VRVVVAGGGSGGHIYPALAIADSLRERLGADVEVNYIGSRHGLERDVVPRTGLPFYPIQAGALLNPGPMAKVQGAMATVEGVWQALWLLKRLRPQVVVGTGGYVSGPVGLAASLLKIPLVIQEQNVWPGLTNRWLARRAAAVLVPFAEAVRYFPSGARIRVVGNPVRPEVVNQDRTAARAKLGLDPGWTVILAFGGSHGAPAINRLMTQVWTAVAARPDVAVLWATGRRYYEAVMTVLSPAPDGHRLRAVDYLYGTETAMAAADLMVARAGMITSAERAARGVPAVLVPSPHVAENHQQKNADFLAAEGAAVVVREAEADRAGLEAVMALVNDPEARHRMGEAARRLHHPDAGQRILDAILEVARR
jgi:UDP-N-acetylglucosamine--N-acetylmuramyl-(pentapeptide) pyrophosphoryl-undecaprenol N-acetylglucosamine transferase